MHNRVREIRTKALAPIAAKKATKENSTKGTITSRSFRCSLIKPQYYCGLIICISCLFYTKLYLQKFKPSSFGV
jgi:hypothetical protein